MAMKKTFFWKENTSIVQRLRPLCPGSCPHGYPHLWKSHFPLTQQSLVKQDWRIILANNRFLVPGPGRIPLRRFPPHEGMETTISEKREARDNCPAKNFHPEGMVFEISPTARPPVRKVGAAIGGSAEGERPAGRRISRAGKFRLTAGEKTE